MGDEGSPGPLANTTVGNQSAPAPALSPCAQRDPVVQRVGHYGSGRPWVGAPITVHPLRCYAVARLLEVFSLCPAAVAELRALPAFADEAVSALFLGVLARVLHLAYWSHGGDAQITSGIGNLQ